jgi:hypothetical protein
VLACIQPVLPRGEAEVNLRSAALCIKVSQGTGPQCLPQGGLPLTVAGFGRVKTRGDLEARVRRSKEITLG